ncbi:TetR/AcrR family transcriptional regulator [Companilactobacillus mishanensis]|uniref:TetR/AcrR family transcriptional regulator n=1 Tax=Companilactobacillus mishanensis TaxID=2486008 RepID=UPI000F79D30F|nr:TetR/AcrR family transcriptional regulator [Companilactobacillus mishanensis]
MAVVDRRVQKTNKALRDAFRDLSRDNRYRDITVKALTEKAGINRKTFYLHYDSIDDFVNTFVDELSNQLLTIITQRPVGETMSISGRIFDDVFDYFDRSRDFLTFLMMSDEYSFLSRQVENNVAAGFAKALRDWYHISKLDATIISSFMIRNVTMLFRMYYRGQAKFTKEEFKNYLLRLDFSGVQSFINKEQ